jgi:hypothetical protein
MTPRLALALRAADCALLGCASLFVPWPQRDEWRREWQSELWHVRQARVPAGAVSFRAERQVAAFCLGSFQDAFCLWLHARRNRPRAVTFRGSARQCLLALALLLAAGWAAARLLPGVRALAHAQPAHLRPGVILIQDFHDDGPTTLVSYHQVDSWKPVSRPYIDEFAFYRIKFEPAPSSARKHEFWRVAYASPNLFALLGLPLRLADPQAAADAAAPNLVLSRSVWRRSFHSSQAIVGTLLNVGGRQFRVAAIAPEGPWSLPGAADAWLLGPQPVSGDEPGYVLAHLTPRGQKELWYGQVQIISYGVDASEHDFRGVTLEETERGPRDFYLFAIILAFLALPAITSVSMSESSFSAHKPSRARRMVRLGFLISKIALVLAISYIVPLDLAYAYRSSTYGSEYIQLALTFSVCLFGMRWVLADQRQRCPVCLKRVGHPAQVGLASRTFLAWNGTELICTEGHTLLHIPGLPTSWFGTQRWMYLDTSWDFLFAG